MNKSINVKNRTAKMKTLGILGTSNSRHWFVTYYTFEEYGTQDHIKY